MKHIRQSIIHYPLSMIKLQYEHTKLELDPKRGLNLCRWSIEEQEIIYVDPVSYANPGPKFVGGNPVMFPIFSTLGLHGESDLHYDGKQIKLNQHGLARLSEDWAWEQSSPAEVSCRLNSSQQSLSIFPWPFQLEVQYRLGERSVHITQRVKNIGDTDLPFVAGFHPYFSISSPRHCEVTGLVEGTPCYFVSNHGADDLDSKLPHRLPLGQAEVNHHFVSHGKQVQLVDHFSGRRIAIRPDAAYQCLTIWSEPERPFICVEPVTARRGAFETRENLIRLQPDHTWEASMSYEVLQL
jgi:galactose mutarotase-like enzyme